MLGSIILCNYTGQVRINSAVALSLQLALRVVWTGLYINGMLASMCARAREDAFVSNCTYWSRSYRVIYKVYHISNEPSLQCM